MAGSWVNASIILCSFDLEQRTSEATCGDLTHANRVLALAKQWSRDQKQKLIFRPIEGELEVNLVHAGTGVRDRCREAKRRLRLKQSMDSINSATSGNEDVRHAVLKAEALGLAAVHDASFMQQPREGSQVGYCIVLSTKALYNGKAVTHLLDWGSSKIHRKVGSTLAAEAASAARAYDLGMYACAMLYEIERGRDDNWRSLCKKVPFCPGTDCKSLYDLCEKNASIPDERRVALDSLNVREGIEEFGDEVRWVPTDHMLVDCMTKTLQPDAMLKYLRDNVYALKYDAESKNTKREVAKARKQVKAEKIDIPSVTNKVKLDQGRPGLAR